LACVVGLSIAAILALGIYLRRDQVASVLPSMGGTLVSYKRGFGDTILKYQDRSYENAAWKKLKEADSLSQIAGADDFKAIAGPYRVVGWDDDTFWVVMESGRVFRCRNGHWSSQGKPEHAREPVARLLDKDTLLIAGGYRNTRHLYQYTPDGLVDHGDLGFSNSGAGTEVCPIAPDLFYCFSREALNRIGTLKVAGGKRTEMPEWKYKEAFVHRDDNTPLKEYPVRGIRNTRTLTAGKAVGLAYQGYRLVSTPKLVSFRNGIWYVVDDLPGHRQTDFRFTITDAWFGVKGDALQFVITVGEEGYVYSHMLNGPGLEQPVSAPQENTSRNLIKVWGVSPEKFWVMDDSGTVWERKGTDWRVVVRGMYRDDVKFVDAWVSPKGNVIAVTDKHVYRLE
jgi:hypothetical protein